MMTRAERRRMERESVSRTTYQFTLEQIEAMKRQAVLDAKEKMKEEIAKEIDEHIQEEWKQREQEMSGENEQERIEKVLALLMSVPARILCEKFHWKGVRDENDHLILHTIQFICFIPVFPDICILVPADPIHLRHDRLRELKEL